MYKFLLLLLSVTIIHSCQKSNEVAEKKKQDTLKAIDSINEIRKKHNDSITILNNKNRFEDISGNHKISFKSGEANFNGTVKMEKTGRDLYKIHGGGKSNANFLNIEGEIIRVSEIHLNFTGKITQKINEKTFSRTKKTTFIDEKKGNFWRLQDKLNGEGFVEYIDIYK